jgi:hypothetical protein
MVKSSPLLTAMLPSFSKSLPVMVKVPPLRPALILPAL